MRPRTLFGQLFPAFVSLSLVSFAAILVFIGVQFHSFYMDEAEKGLRAWNQVATLQGNSSSNLEELTTWALNAGKSSGFRVTVIDSKGVVLVDTNHRPEDMDNHIDRPEVTRALADGHGSFRRMSSTLGEEFVYVATRLSPEFSEPLVFRSARPVQKIYDQLYGVYAQIALGATVVLLLILIYSWRFSKRVSQPLEAMRAQASNISKGDFSGRVHFGLGVSAEVDELGRTMNEIAVQLDRKYQDLLTQKNQQDAVFSSMVEGVVAVDTKERVMFLNVAAARILDISILDSVGMSIQETIRIAEIQNFISQSLRSGEATEQDMELPGGVGARVGHTVTLQIRNNPLMNSQGKRMGTVFVFNDITKMRRLESHRRDFVANVSHELRTPLTSIQGFAETLQSKDVGEEDRGKFLEIIHRHSVRLNAIVEDLLALSRIEREAEEEVIALELGPLRPVLNAALELCLVKAEKRGVKLQLIGQDDFQAMVNSPLLEQAIVNLIDNGVKFSEEGQTVEVNLAKVGSEACISVRDHGPGIGKEHLPRLFERFYRVDKARSRKLGGTGLGLSIVKHVTNAHKGRMDVESELGHGSQFKIFLPLQNGSRLS